MELFKFLILRIHLKNIIFGKLDHGHLNTKFAQWLHKKYNPNIVKFYAINSLSLDMEILETPIIIRNESHATKLLKDMTNARNYLLEIGVVYIDWKLDNIGWSDEDKVFKLFDFNLAGTFNPKTNN